MEKVLAGNIWSKFGKSILISLYDHSSIKEKKKKKNPASVHIVEGWDFKNLEFVDQRNEENLQCISIYGTAMEDVLKQ